MTNLPARPVLTLRARRDTLVLVASAAAVTLLLANAVHHRPAPVDVARAVTPEPLDQTQWVGSLAEPIAPPMRKPEPLTSASLVVARTALPRPPAVRTAPPATSPSKRCDTTTCSAPVAATAPAKNAVAVKVPPHVEARHATKTGWFNGGLNSLKRLPDVVRHPFDVAGDAVTNWFSRL